MDNRISEIDRASGIAIILVVFGHMYFPAFEKNATYDFVRSFVYKIHMPLFMTLSGLIAFYSFRLKKPEKIETYKDFIGKKLRKFLPPYLFFPALAIISDILIRHANSNQVYESVYCWFLMPKSGSAGFVWYLYVLFIFYCLLPLIFNLKKEILFLIFIGSFFLTNLPATQLFCTDLVFRYFFFFLGGGLISNFYDEFSSHIRKYGWIYLSVFTVLAIIDFNIDMRLPFQLLSILFVPTVLYSAGFWFAGRPFQLLSILGQSTFAIYLFSSLVMNIVYLVFSNFLPGWLGTGAMAIIFLCGLIIPIPIKYLFNSLVPRSVYRL